MDASTPLACRRRRFGLLLLAPICLILSQTAWCAQAETVAAVSEYQMKAAFVFNFAVFTEWPAAALANGAPLALCTYAGNELQPFLASLNDKVVNGHKIVVKTLAAAASLHACHVLVLDSADRKLWSRIKQTATEASILTVSNEPGIDDDGTVISLTFENRRIGFDVDLAAARQSRLTLSSKLLRLARNTK
ncbi:MAG: YfiR family protein [Pseudomonadota bacterium]|nr:YfiR family protein [Pseudomonadota bacterium]